MCIALPNANKIPAAGKIATGVLLSFAWPPIQDGLNSLSNFLLNKNLTLTTFIFGIIER
ncbi:hypothetical protein INO77_16360, partial [Staphylococcus aureus]|nr:hypothetical protein [Staphylococcus aureus]